MINFEKDLTLAALEAVKEIYGQELPEKMIQAQKTRKDFEGDLTLVVFPLLKISRKGPEPTANEIGAHLLEKVAMIAGFNVVKGFLNLVISDESWVGQLEQARGEEKFGYSKPSGDTTMVEYSSPNTNKPLHLGHIRNILLGYSVSGILSANGHEAVKVQIINDRGIHICKSMLAWLKWGNGETPESSGMKGDHLVGKYYVEFDKHYKTEIAELVEAGSSQEEAEKQAPSLLEAQEMLRKWEAKEPEVYALWEKMNGWVYDGFDVTYQEMGVDFDKLYYESDTFLLGKEQVMQGVEKGLFYTKDDGSVWCDLSEHKMDDKLLLRADGTSVYMTQDIGTAILRYRDYPSMTGMIYTVGNEQDHHFKVLFIILAKLGYTWAKNCFHLSYGMVDLPSGKMKSREGTVVDADDLMASMIKEAEQECIRREKLDLVPEAERPALYRMLGLGALKYFILKVDPRRRMLFNPKESIDFEGNTGPFIQYTHARIRSLLRTAAEQGHEPQSGGSGMELHPAEKEVIKKICEYPEVIREAGEQHSPALIANYIYDLVKDYNRFYQQVRILNPDDPKIGFRLGMSELVSKIIRSGMGLLGIDVPERM